MPPVQLLALNRQTAQNESSDGSGPDIARPADIDALSGTTWALAYGTVGSDTYVLRFSEPLPAPSRAAASVTGIPCHRTRLRSAVHPDGLPVDQV